MHKILKLREECFLSWSSQRKEYLLHISRLEKFSQSCQTILQFSLNATANLLSSESCSMMHSSPLKHFRGNVASTYCTSKRSNLRINQKEKLKQITLTVYRGKNNCINRQDKQFKAHHMMHLQVTRLQENKEGRVFRIEDSGSINCSPSFFHWKWFPWFTNIDSHVFKQTNQLISMSTLKASDEWD